MICENCGKELIVGRKFCPYCGGEIKEKTVVNNSIQFQQMSQTIGNIFKPKAEAEETQEVLSQSEYSRIFVEPDEQLLGTLGNGYVENILYKKVKKSRALLTNKRVYFQGSVFSGAGKKLVQDKSEKIVDVEDITGTGFIYGNPLGILFQAVLLLVLFIATIVIGIATEFDFDEYSFVGAIAVDVFVPLILLIHYLKNRLTYFVIEYAGGSIKINASIIGLADVKDFQKQIRRAKDYIKQERR